MTTRYIEVIRAALKLCESAAKDNSSSAAFNGSAHDPGAITLARVKAYRDGMNGVLPAFLLPHVAEAERIVNSMDDPEFIEYLRLQAKFGKSK